uniref:Uncharacterized protein n=1 Tax=Lepeophtheirus salmonis TaxID=72036 RepID=A0A0K2SZY8_LEPSM
MLTIAIDTFFEANPRVSSIFLRQSLFSPKQISSVEFDSKCPKVHQGRQPHTNFETVISHFLRHSFSSMSFSHPLSLNEEYHKVF